MSEKASENSETRSPVVSALEEASGIVRYLAEPCPAGDSVRAAILRSARRLRGWSASRVKAVWYADGRTRVSGDELNDLRRIAQINQEAKARVEYADVAEQLAALAAKLDALLADGLRAAPASAGHEVGDRGGALGRAGAADSPLDHERE